MKKIIFTLFALFTMTMFYGASPDKIRAEYNDSLKLLTVEILHPTSNPSSHYIKEVVLTVNGNVIEKKDYTMQSSMDSEKASFNIQLAKNDQVSVEAISTFYGDSTLDFMYNSEKNEYNFLESDFFANYIER